MATSNKFRTFGVEGLLKAQYPAFRFADASGTYESPGGFQPLTASTTAFVVFVKSTGLTTTTTQTVNSDYVYGNQYITNATGIVKEIPYEAVQVAYGVTNGVAAVAGEVGQIISSLVTVNAPVSLTNATAANVTSVVLTAGRWSVTASLNIRAGSATTTSLAGGITSASATTPTNGTEVGAAAIYTTTSFITTLTPAVKQFNLAATTTVYLVAEVSFSAGTVSGYGALIAQRI